MVHKKESCGLLILLSYTTKHKLLEDILSHTLEREK